MAEMVTAVMVMVVVIVGKMMNNLNQFFVIALLSLFQFSCASIAGNPFASRSISNEPVEVKLFINHSCPCSHRLIKDIVQTFEKYPEAKPVFYNVAQVDQKGLDFLTKSWSLPTPMQKDSDKMIANKYKISATPEMVVLKGDEILYKGAVIQEKEVTGEAEKNILDLVLAEIKSGQKLTVQNEEVYGCPLNEGQLIFPTE